MSNRLIFNPGDLIPPSEHLHYVKDDGFKYDGNDPNSKRRRRKVIVYDDRDPNKEEFSTVLEYIRSGNVKHSPYIRHQKAVEHGKSFKGTPNYAKRKYRKGDIIGKYKNILIIEELNKYTSNNKRKCIFKNLDNNKIFESTIDNVVTGCTFGASSQGESLINKLLTELNINFYQEYIPKDFPNKVKYGRQRFDFFLPELNICIEFDGLQQHFEYRENFHKSYEDFLKQQQHDKDKDNYCKNHNIKLIRIPFYDLEKLNKDYLKGLIYD